ncbi:MAG: dihydrofolate reductase [Myxococcales bacterium]|nr:dihydrofolate reductase [Myxococcales bacterium]
MAEASPALTPAPQPAPAARLPLTLVVAVGPRNVIGVGGGLPWHVPEDLKHFKATTMGHAVIMGRKTFESIGRVLPGRRFVVVTRNPDFAFDGVTVARGLDEALRAARETDPEPCVIGGAEIYRAALPLATRVELTEISHEVDGDTFFPELDRAAWRETARRAGETAGVSFVTLER